MRHTCVFMRDDKHQHTLTYHTNTKISTATAACSLFVVGYSLIKSLLVVFVEGCVGVFVLLGDPFGCLGCGLEKLRNCCWCFVYLVNVCGGGSARWVFSCKSECATRHVRVQSPTVLCGREKLAPRFMLASKLCKNVFFFKSFMAVCESYSNSNRQTGYFIKLACTTRSKNRWVICRPSDERHAIDGGFFHGGHVYIHGTLLDVDCPGQSWGSRALLAQTRPPTILSRKSQQTYRYE